MSLYTGEQAFHFRAVDVIASQGDILRQGTVRHEHILRHVAYPMVPSCPGSRVKGHAIYRYLSFHRVDKAEQQAEEGGFYICVLG